MTGAVLRRCPIALVLLMGAVATSACAPMCKEMAADREVFFRRQAVTTAPHATVFIPFALANGLMDKRLADVQPLGAPLSLPGPVGQIIGSVRLAPRRMALGPAPEDRLGLHLEADVLSGEKSLFAMGVDVVVRPEVDTTKGLLAVGLRGDDLKTVKITLGPDATERLATEIRSRLPSLASAVLSSHELGAMAKIATDFLAGQLGALLVRSHLLAPLGEIARLSVEIPLVPISRLSLRSVGKQDGGLLVGIFTALPIGAGLPTAGDWATGPGSAYLRLSAEALAELGNWALVTGLLPRRYDEGMHPKEDGDFTPGLRWLAGSRPFKLFAWRLRKPCLRTQIGAEPIVTVREGQLEVGFDDGALEAVEGASLVQARVWMKRIGADAIRFSRKTIASASIAVAGVPLTFTIRNAFYGDNAFGIELGVE